MKRPTGIRVFICLSILSTGLLLAPFASTGCTDEQDLCKKFCQKAAECLQCGSTANLERCETTCVNLSIDDKKALADCTDDCMIMRACPLFTEHPDLNPCRP